MAQLSRGGRPLPLAETRGLTEHRVEEMPPFDLALELMRDSAENVGLRGGYKFAYKFVTDFGRDNSGASFRLNDGTLVWRLRIRSRGALSINILFTEFELPEGAKLFLYDPKQRQILGAFDCLNNSEDGLLPVAPVWGEEIVVEYQEPERAAFAGKIRVGEINHAYRSLLGYEPGGDAKDMWCMPATQCLASEGGRDSLSRTTVLLTIDGTRACTGVLVNNTSNDGRPLLLTASHCLNNNFQISNPDYVAIAGRIITFFNYNSPTCDTVIRGAEEMSMASARLLGVNESVDMALLELNGMPPPHFRPFYAGWTLDEKGGLPPYTVLHHPRASPKRYNRVADTLTLRTFPISHFQANSHWNVGLYAEGCTDAGSSGGPLFDDSSRLVGLLSGGNSSCNDPRDDFYYALHKAWEPSSNAGEQLKAWLDTAGVKANQIGGIDPYESSPSYRLSNIMEARLNDSIEVAQHPQGGNLFGLNASGAKEFAEEYQVFGTAYVEGAYIVTPSVTDDPSTMKTEIVLYASINGRAADELHSEPFSPAYKDMSPPGYAVVEAPKRLNRAQETFVKFAAPVKVTGSFFIGYRISSPPYSSFAAYNLRRGMTVGNTTWIRSTGGWIQAPQFANVGFATSLFIDPVVRYTDGSSVEPVPELPPAGIYTERGRRALHIVLEPNISSAILILYDLNGRKLIERRIEGSSATIELEDQAPGIYIAQLRYGTESYSQKLVL
jgi:hypothetical protein